MLYDRWREVARAGGTELALKDLGDGRAWTFAQLLEASDRAPDEGEWISPKGNGPEFIFELLRGWRRGRVVCPLDVGEAPPDFAAPPGTAHLKRTSATTGAARYVAFTEEQLAVDPANIVRTMGLRPEWPNVGAISLAHSYGFSNLVLPLLLHGIPLALLPAPLPEALRQVCASVESVSLAGVPALWRVWHEAGAILPSVKLAISAGAPLPIALEEDVLRKCGIKIHNFLGATECGGIAYDRSESVRTDGAMVGTAMENVALSVSDGMLEVRGAAVGWRYWPEARPELMDGVFRTSDLVELIDGKLFIRGRASDVIHIAGRKVPPEQIERELLKHSAVKECLVFAAPRRDEENQIVAVIVGDEKARDEIRKFAAERLQPWQAPRQWWFVESLGANERGKVSRAQWREKFIGRKE
jgi:long-chain acyl-CoA synthetase